MNCAIVVLGSPNDQEGNLLPIAISRAQTALVEYQQMDNCKLLCTGGYGEQFNATDKPHGYYLQKYLMSQGVSASSFLDIALSRFTLEDATLSKPIFEKHNITQCILVTSDFHMARAKLVFNHVFPNMAFKYCEAKTLTTEESMQKLISHEHMAIKREQASFKVK